MELQEFYKKLTMANLLNWFAMRLFRVASRFCARLVGRAVKLDPTRVIFQKNLLSLNKVSGGRALPKSRKRTFPFYSFAEGCKLLDQKINYFDQNQTISLSLPKVINEDFKVSSEYKCEAILPDTYLAELDNAMTFGGTDLVIVQDTVLYDEVKRGEEYIYGIKSPVVDKIDFQSVTIKLPKKITKTIDCGIHFAKDHSRNYFHWIVECLPRLSLIKNLDKNIPLLVDEDLPPQFYEALQLLNEEGRELIKLKFGETYEVKNLYYPSQLSIVHDNYNLPIYNKDAYYSPKAINYIRDSFLKKIDVSGNIYNRKLYISRKNSDYRQLLNNDDIENLLLNHGFEIVFPENLSLIAQVRLFSQAKIIIGQSGAGMTNFIFAPADCKILMMVSDAPQTNLHLFNTLAQSIDISIDFIIGKSASSFHKKFTIHKDFYVDTKLILYYLENNL